MQPSTNLIDLRAEIVGLDQRVPLLDGSTATYVNLDNAASTPPFKRVQAKVDEVMGWYSSVHRGSGFKSLLSTHLYDQSREIVAGFVGANLSDHTVVFVKNASEAINKLAHRLCLQPDDVVLTTLMEHHSNDLPWRAVAHVVYAGLNPDGSLDLNDLEAKLKEYDGKVRLVAVTGASNVTGFVNPIYDIAELAHRYGALIAADCAQLFPHRRVQMGKPGQPRSLDFIAVSAHKVYAPFGSGALIGARALLNCGEPDYRGGGTIELVTLDEVRWADTPERDEAGSPNVIGAVALAAALRQLEAAGMETVAAHEAELTTYALERLNRMPFLRLAGSRDPQRTADRLGVITFTIPGISHGKAAAILGFEGGIGVRNGCFCAHPYVLRLLDVGDDEFHAFRERVIDHDRTDLPGLVRMSFGCYNNTADIDRLLVWLERIARGDYQGEYVVDRRSGSYYPASFDMSLLEQYYAL
jgi:selenocysteine lyase/cysteine desulfurase